MGPAESRILAGLRILAVDDDQDTRKLLEVVLGKYGAEVKSVGSAAEALREVTAESSPRPDVLICDIAMPDESGYDLIHKVRMLKPERGGSIPAIALTGYTSAVDRMRALAAGFQNHVSKPIEPQELSTVIASVANRLA